MKQAEESYSMEMELPIIDQGDVKSAAVKVRKTMMSIDKRNRLDEEVFTFREAKDGRVMLYWHDKHVKTLAGPEARKFLKKIDDLEGKEAQLVMAKVTGNFKHGNERNSNAAKG